jgi:hypothetical protein
MGMFSSFQSARKCRSHLKERFFTRFWSMVSRRAGLRFVRQNLQAPLRDQRSSRHYCVLAFPPVLVACHSETTFLSTNPSIRLSESERPAYTLSSDSAGTTFDLSNAYLCQITQRKN